MKNIEKQIFELKSKIDKSRPFGSALLKNLKSWFNIGFTAHSNAIEGNSYTLEEVKVLVEDGITIGGKTIRETKETQNLAELINIIWDFFEKDFILTEKFLLDLHKNLLNGIEKENLGRYREIPVFITGSEEKLLSSKKVPELIKNFIEFCNKEVPHPSPLLNEERGGFVLKKIARIHFDFVKIHPFVDGNGRIARLLMNLYLVKYGFLPIIFPVITSLDYIKSLGNGKKLDDFYKYFLWQLDQNLQDYLRFLED